MIGYNVPQCSHGAGTMLTESFRKAGLVGRHSGDRVPGGSFNRPTLARPWPGRILQDGTSCHGHLSQFTGVPSPRSSWHPPPPPPSPSFKRTRTLCQGQDPTPVSNATQAILLPSLVPGNHVSDCLETLRPSFASNHRLCSKEGKGCGGSCF